MTQYDINALLVDEYEVDNDQQSSHKNKPRYRGDTDQPIYKDGWFWNRIHYRMTAIQWQDSEKFDGMNE